MYINKEIYISPKYKKQDFLDLNLTLNSSEVDWKSAIHILEDRISGRFFNFKNFSTYSDFEDYFSIMAINCLLIETFLQFERGISETPNGTNLRSYKSFLVKNFELTNKQATFFYKDIRCGILHSAQTKNNSQLTYGDENFITDLDNGIRINVDKFSIKLKNIFYTYLFNLQSNQNLNLRINFIKKMNFICR